MPFLLPLLPWLVGGGAGFFAGSATSGGLKWLFWLALLAFAAFVMRLMGVF